MDMEQVENYFCLAMHCYLSPVIGHYYVVINFWRQSAENAISYDCNFNLSEWLQGENVQLASFT